MLEALRLAGREGMLCQANSRLFPAAVLAAGGPYYHVSATKNAYGFKLACSPKVVDCSTYELDPAGTHCCGDGARNFGETNVDCGGPCGSCAPLSVQPSNPSTSCDGGVASVALAATGGWPPYAWSATKGSLAISGAQDENALWTIGSTVNPAPGSDAYLTSSCVPKCVTNVPCGEFGALRAHYECQHIVRAFGCDGKEIPDSTLAQACSSNSSGCGSDNQCSPSRLMWHCQQIYGRWPPGSVCNLFTECASQTIDRRDAYTSMQDGGCKPCALEATGTLTVRVT